MGGNGSGAPRARQPRGPQTPQQCPTRLDDVVPQANDQGVGAVGLELVPKLIEDLVEFGQVPGPDG